MTGSGRSRREIWLSSVGRRLRPRRREDGDDRDRDTSTDHVGYAPIVNRYMW